MFLNNIEILAWIDSSIYAEYNGASFKENNEVMTIFIQSGS